MVFRCTCYTLEFNEQIPQNFQKYFQTETYFYTKSDFLNYLLRVLVLNYHETSDDVLK